MPSHYKAFLVVMVLTVVAFWLARPAFTRFMTDEDFVRRRNLWLSITTSAFLLPSFWLHMAVAAALIWRAGRRDPNPAALYLFLLLAVPPFQQVIPGFGVVNQLFALDHFRLLGLVLIVPAAWRLRQVAPDPFATSARRTWLAPDVMLVVYFGLQIALSAPYSSATDTLRSVFLVTLDVLLPYFVLSRCCTSKPVIVEAIAAFTLSAIVLVPSALFETAKGWLMYSEIANHWGIDSDVFGYLMRGGTLRAQVTSGQSIVLGNFFAVALGLWLYLQSGLAGWRRWLGTAGVLAGLLAAFSRGPWVGAVVCAFVFFAVGPNAKVRIAKFLAVSFLVAVVALASPIGDEIIDNLPFIGTVDAGNVSYRQDVINRSWAIIELNPLFGSPYFIRYMEDLRTGQGIIDLLNVYLSIGMAYGLVTLGALVLFFATAVYRCLKVTRANALIDPDTAKLGAALLAALLGTLVIIYTVSNYLSVPYIYFGLVALMVAYTRVPSVAVDRSPRESAVPGPGTNVHFGLRS